MTITEARKILGVFGKKISDEDIAKDIESAELLKNIFFKLYLDKINRNKLQSIKHGKESSNLH